MYNLLINHLHKTKLKMTTKQNNSHSFCLCIKIDFKQIMIFNFHELNYNKQYIILIILTG